MKYFFYLTLLPFFCFVSLGAKLVHYELRLEKDYDPSSKQSRILVNKHFPAPPLRANLGDTLRVRVHNALEESTSLHWHGVSVPHEQNGVAYLDAPPILPHSSYTYEFVLHRPGTYSYHAMDAFQQQKGLYGSLVVSGDHSPKHYDKEYVLVLSDWSQEDSQQVLKNIKRESRYYGSYNNTLWSWKGLLNTANQEIFYHLAQIIERKRPRILAEYRYDACLVNGKEEEQVNVNIGGHLRLRVINASSSSYFDLSYAGEEMTLFCADGQEIQARNVKTLTLANGESCDVLVKRKEEKAYEFRASSQEGKTSVSCYIGQGEKVAVSPYQSPLSRYPKFSHSLAVYPLLKSSHKTALDEEKPWREMTLQLSHNERRYTWFFDKKLFSESTPPVIRRGENIRLYLDNQTAYPQPLHLHGHLFRVVNAYGDYAPLKHTVSVPPYQKIAIEFEANKQHQWLLESTRPLRSYTGLRQVISYKEKEENPFKQVEKLYTDSLFYRSGDFYAFSQRLNLQAKAFNARNTFQLDLQYLFKQDYEHRFSYQRNLSPHLDFYLGGKAAKRNLRRLKNVAFGGLHYTLPLLVELSLELDSNEQLIALFKNEHMLSDTSRLSWQVDSKGEYRIGYRYEYSKELSWGLEYDYRAYFGAGLILHF